MMNKTTNDRGQSNARARSFDPVKLLRYSLLCMLVMLCGGSAWAQDDPLEGRTPEVTLDFTGSTDNWKIGTTKLVDEKSFTYGDYTIKLKGTTGNGYRWYNDGYVLLGKQGATLTLPAFDFDVDYITIEGTSGASTGVKQNIFVGEDAVSTETTGAKNVTNRYEINSNSQSAGNVYILKITSDHNTQFSKINIYKKEEAGAIKAPVITPTTGTYTEAQNVTITCATSDATIYYTLDGSDPSATNGTKYTTSFNLTETKTVKAIAIKGDKASSITTAELTINIPHAFTLPWTEDWSGYANGDLPSDYTSYYEQTGSGTKIYTGTMSAGGESPELLISKTNGSFTIKEFDLSSLNGEAAVLQLQYNANGNLTLSTTETNVTIGTAVKNDKVYTHKITIPAGTTKFDLTFKNTTSSNIRIDDLSLAITNAPMEPTFSPAAGTYYGAQNVTITCTTAGATIYYSTDNETFSPYSGPIEVSETKTIYAYSQVGEEKSATASAKYTIGALYTSIQNMQAAATSTATPMHFTPSSTLQVVYVKGKNAYVVDENGYGLLIYNNSSLKLNGETAVTAGQVLSGGTIMGALQLYYGNTEISGFSTENVTISNAEVTPVEKALPLTGANQSTLVTLKGVTYDANAKSFSDGENTIAYNDKFSASPTLEDGKTYDVTGIVNYNNETLQISPRTAEDITEVIIAPAEFQDFEAIVNNQTGTLLTTDEQVQGTAVSFGIAVDTEGKTTRVAADNASSIATISGVYHSDHGLTNMKVVTAVPGAVKILVGKCTYATTKITVTNSDGQTVAEYTPQGEQGSGDLVCWKNDHSNVMELIYTGEATTLTITGMKYCPFIAVKKYVAPAEFQDFEAIVNNQTGTLLTTDEQVQGTAVSFGIAVDTEGKTTRVAADNASSIATISGVYHSDHGLTNMKVVTPVPGAVKILVGKCTYATTKITVTNSDGQTVAEYTPQGEEGSGDRVCWKNDDKNVMELIYTGEATTLTITGMKYCPFIAVKKIIETGPVTLDNEPATATFPFNLGTEGQKATFSNADYWLNSKVVLGSNNSYKGTTTISNTTMTLIEPTAQLQNADETGTIRFRINPKPGFTFTPNKVSLKASKVGTDNGKINVAWENPDKTTISLATEIAPTRNNSGLSSLEYNIEGATAGEGACGVVVSLYGLQNGKQMAFSDIVIEGTLSGTEKDVPVLATFTINNKEYQVEEVFGDEYEATLKLSKAEAMVSSTNAVTATATNGTIGTITYENATEEGCKVTIPVTADETTLNYVLNVIQKPDYTLTYYAVDGTTVLDTDTREEDQAIGDFKVNIADVEASMDGYKARGWFKQNNVGAKYKTTDVVTSNLNLYAVETEIEVSSDFKKYEYDLTDVNFDANDHEAFNPTGIARWHDKQHGWEFKNGDKIDLLVGPKANIIFTLCQHSAAGSTITWDTENSISAVGESDAAIETIAYEGEAGTLSLTINTSNTVYIHRIKIVNTTTTNYTQDGQWIFVKPGDASSFLDALDAANATDGEENVFIFLPNGTYDLGHKTKTSIGRNNISIIGNSMDEVIIKNAPTTEGIDVTATLLNTSSNLYMQDLTIECDAPWIGNAERGVTLQDKGNQTILKNVYLKGKQDTYYSNNPDGTFYFENGMIQGSVDYVCGYGDVYFNNTSFYTVNKSTGGKGGCIAAPNTLKSFGYIFNSCILDGQENENGLYRLARPWGADTKCFFVNTIMVIQPNAAGWGEWSSPKNAVTQFAEYNSVDGSGTPIDLTSRATTIGDQPNNPWLTEAEAAALTPNAIFNGDWKPQVIAMQLNPPSGKLKDGTITWDAVKDAIAYAIYDGDELLGITTGTSWTIENVTSAPRHAQGTYSSYSLRSANSRGGFGEAVLVSYATGIDATLNDNEETTNEKVIYDLNGRRVLTPTKGVYIINGRKVVIK